MTEQKDTNQPEIYDMSVNNPLAQNFLEKSAFLKFLIQQLKQLRQPDGQVLGEVAKYNTYIMQLRRVRTELYAVKKEIQDQIDKFKVKLEEINQRRRYTSQLIMQLTREKSSGEIDQDTYLKKKYEMEMKRKSLGNQVQILNKNLSIFGNLMNTPIPADDFEEVEQPDDESIDPEADAPFTGPEVFDDDDLDSEAETPIDDTRHPLGDDESLLDNAGITYMGVLSAAEVQAGLGKQIKDLAGGGTQPAGDVPAAPPKGRPPRLNIITETGRQYFYPLSPNNVVRIGRSSQNDIQIPSPAVSRNHAEIRFDGNEYFVVDLESSNGTFVNDKMVMRRKIEPNDTISIGGTRLIFLL